MADACTPLLWLLGALLILLLVVMVWAADDEAPETLPRTPKDFDTPDTAG